MSSAVRVEWVTQPGWPHAEAILAQVEALFAGSAQSLYRARNEIRRVEFAGQDLVIKSFRRPSGVNRFVYGHLRKSKARRSYENALTLKRLGLWTPEPVGYREIYRGGLLAESFFVSAYYAPRYRLEQVLHGDGVPERETILRAFGRFVARLHELGVLHRDLSPGNVLIRRLDDDHEFCLIDTNRMTFGALGPRQRARNFSMLWANDADLVTIVTAYAETAGLDGRDTCRRALAESHAHKARCERKERIKRWFGR